VKTSGMISIEPKPILLKPGINLDNRGLDHIVYSRKAVEKNTNPRLNFVDRSKTPFNIHRFPQFMSETPASIGCN